MHDLNHHFSLIGISETRLRKDVDPITNIEIPGYQFFHTGSLCNAGGVGFYIDNTFSVTQSYDLSVVILIMNHSC